MTNIKSTKTFIARCIFPVICVFVCHNAQCAEPAGQPNVILVMTDDQGYGDVRSHDNPLIDTPNLDQLAKDGVRFKNFFVSPLCAPTRASLLTGRYHIRTGTVNVSNRLEIMRHEETTIAELFKANGYNTALFGKWHNGEHFPHNPNGQGFDEFVGFCAGHFGNYFDPVLEHNAGTIETDGFITDVLTDKAMEWIEANRNEKFFCYIPYNAPHTPYQVPDAHYEKYSARGLDVKTATLYGMVENIDDNIGRLLTKLEDLGLQENTIVLFLTDNGPNTPDRYNGGMKGHKGHVDEGGVRVPLFARWSGHIKPDRVVDGLAAHIDLLPTLADLCDIEIPESLQLDGRSLKASLLDGQSAPSDRMIFTHRYWAKNLQLPNGAARSLRYRYVLTAKEESLFDLVEDPGQKKDISKQFPEQFQRHRAAYRNWFSDVSKDWELESLIPCGYQQFPITHLHAVQSKLSGSLKFHGRGFHHDWIVNWVDPDDKIAWDINVMEAGEYRVAVKYNCATKDIGSQIRVTVNENELKAIVDQPFEPALFPNRDRAPRSGELEKPWATLELGRMGLVRGTTKLVLSADRMPGGQVMEVRKVILERVFEDLPRTSNARQE
ncbi:MAG: sulfatase-like hydrolase/transferase [Planctomycetota bacterium]